MPAFTKVISKQEELLLVKLADKILDKVIGKILDKNFFEVIRMKHNFH